MFRFLFCLIASLLLLSGCSPLFRGDPRSSSAQDLYRCQIKYPGQTISHIAGWYTGKQSNWTTILAHNPGLDPRRLKVGDTVLIPAAMLVRRDSFPKSRLEAPKSSVGLSTVTNTGPPPGVTPPAKPELPNIDSEADDSPVAKRPTDSPVVEPSLDSKSASNPAESAASSGGSSAPEGNIPVAPATERGAADSAQAKKFLKTKVSAAEFSGSGRGALKRTLPKPAAPGGISACDGIGCVLEEVQAKEVPRETPATAPAELQR